MNGLILGRSPNLWVGAGSAVFGVVAFVASLPPQLDALVLVAIGAVVTLVAGNDGIQQAAGNAAAARSQVTPAS